MIKNWSAEDEMTLSKLVEAVNSGKTNRDAVYDVFAERTRDSIDNKIRRLNLRFEDVSYANEEILRLHGFDKNGNYLGTGKKEQEKKNGCNSIREF